MFKQIGACLDGKIQNQDICDEIFLNASMMAELEAINLYKTISANTKNKNISKLMLDIAKEERVHVGEFQSLLHDIYPRTLELELQGKEERVGKGAYRILY